MHLHYVKTNPVTLGKLPPLSGFPHVPNGQGGNANQERLLLPESVSHYSASV